MPSDRRSGFNTICFWRKNAVNLWYQIMEDGRRRLFLYTGSPFFDEFSRGERFFRRHVVFLTWHVEIFIRVQGPKRSGLCLFLPAGKVKNVNAGSCRPGCPSSDDGGLPGFRRVAFLPVGCAVGGRHFRSPQPLLDLHPDK